MLDGNIFREARDLLKTKPFEEMNGEEIITVKAAVIPLIILPEFSNKTTDESLRILEKIFDKAR